MTGSEKRRHGPERFELKQSFLESLISHYQKSISKLILEFSPAPILLDKIRKLAPKVNIIAFKVEQKKEVVQKKGYELLVKNKLDAVIANTIDAFQKDTNEIFIITKKQEMIHKKGKKEDLAKDILELIT